MLELRGKKVVDLVEEQIRKDVESLGKEGAVPTLGLIRVGERPDDLAYERGFSNGRSAWGSR